MYEINYSNKASKDAKKVNKSILKSKILELLEIIQKDPWAPYPPFELLTNDLKGCYSRRINDQHRLVYQVFKETKTIKIHSMWSHYGDN